MRVERFIGAGIAGRGALLAAPLVACLLVAAAGSTGAPAAQEGTAKAGKIRALVAGKADSPVLDALERRLGSRLHVKRSSRVKSARQARHDLLIVDGDERSPRELARSGALQRLTSAHRWVLGIDLGKRHHAGAIADLTGFRAPEQGNGHESDAFLFHRSLAGGTPGTQMVDVPRLRPYGAKHVSHARRNSLVRTKAREFARLIEQNVTGAGASGLTEGAALPAELQHYGWTYSVIGHGVPPNGYWTSGKGDPSLIFYPKPGSQTTSWTMNYGFDVYLDNDPARPAAQHHQIVTYSLDGQVTPKLPNESFFHMSDGFQVGLATGYQLERSWWTGIVDVLATPDAATDPKLVWQASLPETENTSHEYTTGQDFTVGFSAGSEGSGVHADYSVHSDRSTSVPDWGVENQTTQNDLRWRYSSRDPCDPRPDHYNVDQCFDKAEPNGTYWGPHQPNDLSTGQLPVRASGRWATNGVLDGANASLGLAVDTPVTLVVTACTDFEFGVCPRVERKIDRRQVGPGPKNVSIDVSKVVPVGIDSLSVPNAVNGHVNEKATGTVTLEKPAPMDVTVVITSDSANASVGAQSGRGSRREITIPEGQKSGTFQILTKDDGVAPGGYATANITAFYAEPTSEQMTVCAGPPPCK